MEILPKADFRILYLSLIINTFQEVFGLHILTWYWQMFLRSKIIPLLTACQDTAPDLLLSSSWNPTLDPSNLVPTIQFRVSLKSWNSLYNMLTLKVNLIQTQKTACFFNCPDRSALFIQYVLLADVINSHSRLVCFLFQFQCNRVFLFPI